MPRRRYRLFAVCAAMMVFLLYRVRQNSWDSADILRQPLKLKDYLSTDMESSEAASSVQQPDVAGLKGGTAAHQKEADAQAGVKRPASGTKPNQADEHSTHSGQDKDEVAATEDVAAAAVIHWERQKEHFPVPDSKVISLPSGSPKTLPKIQFDFTSESTAAQEKRQRRQALVKKEVQRAWEGYKKYAWTHDELVPVTGKFRDPFCGWAATMVDSLDTLWIAGMTEEFDEAVQATAKIDFTTTSRSDIPVFETTIRYLGGLISAYDVSGGEKGEYSILLEKAVELAEILMGIFDTPNRMPLLYYHWQPEQASQPQQAGRVNIAELGTLSLEFTRLAQITKVQKYYDAVARITDALVQFQAEQASVPGLFPENLDASGCNRTAAFSRLAEDDQAAQANAKREPLPEAATLEKRAPVGAASDATELDCVPQGLASSSTTMEVYHMGGSQDSAYEYFPKQYMLLGGLEDKYKKLHVDTVGAINEQLLFRPMIEDANDEWDILFPARMTKYIGSPVEYRYEVTHLTCFIGGMYGLGGRIFGREEDVEVAKKLTDGCVWAYSSTMSGIMPEGSEILPCPSLKKCEFNQTAWYAELDPSSEWRAKEIEKWESTASSKSGDDDDDDEKTNRLGDNELRESKKLKASKLKASKLKASGSKGDADARAKSAEANAAWLAEAAANGVPEAVTEVKYGKLLNKETGQDPSSEDLDALKGSKDKPKDTSLKSTKEYDEDASYKGTVAEDTKLKTGLKDEDNEYKIEKDPHAPKTDTMLDSKDPLVQAEAIERAKDALGEVDEASTTTQDTTANKILDYSKKVLKAPLLGKRDVSDADHAETKKSSKKEEAAAARTVDSEKPLTHEEYVEDKIQNQGLPPGFTNIKSRGYILRPEAIESVWYMYRITGDPSWQEKGWRMFEATIAATRTQSGHSAVDDVTKSLPLLQDEMESFWIAETLKYYYLLFSEPDLISLDEYVLNTEAHPFKRPV